MPVRAEEQNHEREEKERKVSSCLIKSVSFGPESPANIVEMGSADLEPHDLA